MKVSQGSPVVVEKLKAFIPESLTVPVQDLPGMSEDGKVQLYGFNTGLQHHGILPLAAAGLWLHMGAPMQVVVFS